MQQEDWNALEAQMGSPWGRMTLKCDQFEVTLVQETSPKSKSWRTSVYVDGVIKGEWMRAEGDQPKCEEARRFLRRVGRSAYTKKQIDEWRKVFGKREAAKMEAQKYFYFDPGWSSYRSLKKHLQENNNSIERIH